MPRPLDRNSPASARAIVCRLFPDDGARREAATMLRVGIEAAHAEDEASWGVTLRADAVRLNVGTSALLTLDKNGATLRGMASGAVTPERVREDATAAARRFGDQRISNPSWRGAHSPGVLEWLRDELQTEVPTPSYALSTQETQKPAPSVFKAQAALQKLSASAGLELPASHLAAVWTALQTKGFVLLSGRSGTGKTRLALALAQTLRGESSGHLVALDERFEATGHLLLPPEIARTASDGPVGIVCDGQSFRARLSGELLVVRGAAKKCVRATFGSGQKLGVETEWDENGVVFRLLPVESQSSDSNALFVPVRPDWSDPKALLGYFNPLLSRYEWTPLLRFLLRADRAFAQGDRTPYFVILDEMNLARIEHYFADFLSLLEAGRDASNRTREPLRFEFDPRASGELPPRELRLPPNLYFVGTLNDDETTWPLSPRVRDRAWMIPSPPVDFSTYQPGATALAPSSFEKRDLARHFTRDGRFNGFDKALVAQELERDPAWRKHLSELNAQLGAHGFGFRVFDEIVAFCALARENGLWNDINAAFDAAVSAKIVARFDVGSYGTNEPLERLREWAQKHGLEQTARETEEKLRGA